MLNRENLMSVRDILPCTSAKLDTHRIYELPPYNEKRLVFLQQDGTPIKDTHVKDPVCVQRPDGTWWMYCTFDNGNSFSNTIFKADRLDTPRWIHVGKAHIHNIPEKNPCLCAIGIHPIVMDGETWYEAFVHTHYLPQRERSNNPKIRRLLSKDGKNFVQDGSITDGYDPDVVDIDGETIVLFSRYRQRMINRISEVSMKQHSVSTWKKVENTHHFGDIYGLRLENELSCAPPQWKGKIPLITQEEVPGQNTPLHEIGEWGLEAPRIIKLKDNLFLWVFVSFMEGYKRAQRLMWGVSRSLDEQPTFIGNPYSVTSKPKKIRRFKDQGILASTLMQYGKKPFCSVNREYGHDFIQVVGDKVIDIRQQRDNDTEWYCVTTIFNREELSEHLEKYLPSQEQMPVESPLHPFYSPHATLSLMAEPI